MIDLSFILQATTEVRELTWQLPIPTWVWILCIVPLVALFAVAIYRRELRAREDGGGRASRGAVFWLLVGLRALAILIVIALIAQPVLRTTAYENLDASILLLVDDSLSMDIADKYSERERLEKIAETLHATPDNVEATKRYDLVRRLLRDEEIGLLEKLRAKGKVSIASLAGGVQKLRELPRAESGTPPLAAADLDVLPAYDTVRSSARVRETRLADGLLDGVSGERGGTLAGKETRVAAVVLFSDGQQTPGGRPIEEAARRLGAQRVPVHTVGIGNPDEPKDIRVLALEVNDVVLAGDLVPFDVAIVADGFKDERVRVDLRIDGAVVATQQVVLGESGQRQTVRLEHRPPKPGDYTAKVEVEKRAGELFTENNSTSRPLKVLDQKIRVLYADGLPRWEYRYLMWTLTRDPTMQAQVFLFSADPGFVHERSEGLTSLTEFPRKREELFSYHVIILGDVDIEKRLTPEQISLLREFVYDAGGGLVFIAGDTANPWKYLHTDLYSLLPVEVPERAALDLGTGPKTQAINVELTPVGKEHALMRLDSDSEKNLKLWENRDGQPVGHLPGFVSFHEVGRAKKGAVVLARHPSKTHPLDQKGLVVFAFMNYGKGRTFFSAVDDTWRWRAGVHNLYFHRFWGQVVRFCATGRLLGKTPRFSIATDKASYTIGETVNVECRVYDANMKPATEKSLTIYHHEQAGEGTAPVPMELQLDPVQGQGTYHGAFAANRLGLHDLWIGTENERSAFRTFEVVVPDVELRDPRRNSAALEEISRLSGGSAVELYNVSELVDKIDAESPSREGKVEDDPLWDDFWLVLLFTGILSLEWILRKLVNLL